MLCPVSVYLTHSIPIHAVASMPVSQAHAWEKSFGCLSCHACAVGVFSQLFSFSGFLFVVAAMLKLKAYFQRIRDVAFYIGCPEQVLPLCPSPPQPCVLFHG